MNKSRVRFDPLYRIIDETDEMRLVEGKFQPLFNRLKNMNNLGIIPTILEGAKHSKYEHHSGVLYQINSLIEYDYIPSDYHKPLIISSLFLHIGHFPFTYSTERASLIAVNLDSTVKNFFIKKIEKIFKATDVNNCQSRLDELFSLSNYKLLYKYNSAFILLEKWSKIKDNLDLEDNKKDDVLKIALTNIFDNENSDGYKYIELADKSDYVQRDALYFGSVRLDISPKHLYRVNPLIENFQINEWHLIDTNLRYLTETYYHNTNVRWFSRIFEKIVANLIINKNFDLNWLFEYDDNEFQLLITKNRKKNNQLAKLQNPLIKLAKKLFDNELTFSLIFNIKEVFFIDKTPLELECNLIGVKQINKTILNYPFKRGILLDIDYDDTMQCSFLSPTYSGFTQYSIGVYQDYNNRKMIEIIKVIQNISKNCSFTHVENIRKGIGKQCSWTQNCRINNDEIIKAITEIIMSIERDSSDKQNSYALKFLKDLQKIKTFSLIWDNPENYLRIRLIESDIERIAKKLSEIEDYYETYQSFVEMILLLPTKLLQYDSTKWFINKIIERIKKEGPNKNENIKGNFFEALWLLNRIIESNANYSFFISGLVVIDLTKPKRERDVNEFDVIEFSLDGKNNVNCWVYACSISDNYITENEAQLNLFVKQLSSLYKDVNIETRYIIPKSKQNWTPEIKQALFHFKAE